MAVIKDVANLSGVSVGTISKYLNNPDSLKATTRIKVESAINELDYRPSPLARSMRTGRSNMITVIAPNISNPFFAEVYNSIRRNAALSGYTSILFTIDDDIKILENYLDNIKKHPTDGLVLCFVDEDELIEAYTDKICDSVPSVLLSWDIGNERFNRVCMDVNEGMYKAVAYLVSRGYRRIAYAGGPEKNRISIQKFKGYSRALEEAEIEMAPELIFHGPLLMQTGYQTAKKIFELSRLPDAVSAENDIVGLGCMKYFSQRRIRIPDDIAVIGFDNIMISAIYDPALSTIALPINQMGEASIRLLDEVIKKPKGGNRLVVLGNELIIRKSTDKTAPLVLDF